MKNFSVFITILLLLAMCSCVASHDHQHHHDKKMEKHRKPKFEHAKKGGVMKFCPNSTDCSQMVILKMKKLREVDADGNDVGNKAIFEYRDFEWSTPVQESNDGVNRTKVEFSSSITVGDSNTTTSFQMMTYIYESNGTSPNANLTLDIPEGSFKFAINITNWPWKNENNSLQFGIKAHIITRNGNWTKSKNSLKKQKKAEKFLERVDFGEGMFMEAPEICDGDGVPALVNTTVVPAEYDGIDMDWTFPYFEEYLFYDPVFSVDEQEENTDESGNTDGNGTDNTDGSGDGNTASLSATFSYSLLFFLMALIMDF